MKYKPTDYELRRVYEDHNADGMDQAHETQILDEDYVLNGDGKESFENAEGSQGAYQDVNNSVENQKRQGVDSPSFSKPRSYPNAADTIQGERTMKSDDNTLNSHGGKDASSTSSGINGYSAAMTGENDVGGYDSNSSIMKSIAGMFSPLVSTGKQR